MKAHRINFDDFNSVFINREFDFRYRLTKRIYLIDDEKGILSIEEHPSPLGYVFFLLVIIAALPITILSSGIKSTPSLASEFYSVFVRRDPLRKDELKPDHASTLKLLSVLGLEGLIDG